MCLEQHFRQRGKQFKREMDQLRSSNHKEMIFEASTFSIMLFATANVYAYHNSLTSPLTRFLMTVQQIIVNTICNLGTPFFLEILLLTLLDSNLCGIIIILY